MSKAAGTLGVMQIVSREEIEVSGLDDWRLLAQRLHARFRASDPHDAAEAVTAMLEESGFRAEHVELRLLGPVIDLAVGTRRGGWCVTARDLDLAGQLSDVARDLELTPEPAEVTQLELALDTAGQDAVGRFWAALLTGRTDSLIEETVFDPTDRVPSLWFQTTDDHEIPRQRWHLDLWLAPEAAPGRIAAALAAGGDLVDDSHAPSFTVLADPDGNRVCICTSLDRG